MPQHLRTLLICLALAVAFTGLFQHTGIGINLLLFEGLAVAALALGTHRPVITPLLRPLMLGVFATAVAVVVHASSMAVVLNLLSVALTAGLLLAPQLSSLHHALLLAVRHLWRVPAAFKGLIPVRGTAAARTALTPRTAVTMAGVPVVLVLFATLYSGSNPYFGAQVDRFYAFIGDADLTLLLTFLLGMLISGFLVLRTVHACFLAWAGAKHDSLGTVAPPTDRTELRTAITLFAALNALLLLLNILDVQHVWLHFAFTGQYLKEFVHQGTWMLIVSIVLGAALVLHFFRGGLNFIRGKGPLQWLCLAWLAQNAVLAASVGMRTYWYVHHYGLAYKRIGVVLFLLTVVVALWLVARKVLHMRSAYYLTRWTALTAYLVLVTAALFDWDTIITRHNLAHRHQAFVELGFLAFLDERTLPQLQLERTELNAITAHNEAVLGEERYGRFPYMSPEDYTAAVTRRSGAFLEEYPKRSWREWNWADARAYAALNGR